MTCCSVVIELSHQLLQLWDSEICSQGFEMLRLMLILCLLCSRKWDCKKGSGAQRFSAEGKRVYCLNRDECLAFQYQYFRSQEFMQFRSLFGQAIALRCKTGRNWDTTI